MAYLDVLDGSMGLYLMHTGVPENHSIWSASALVDPKYHRNVINAHKDYLKSGSNIITTNNYACIPGYLSQVNRSHEIERLTKLSVQLAHTAKNEYMLENNVAAKNNNIQIAGCIPPLMESYRPDLRLNESLSLTYYSRIIKSLLYGTNGCDILLIETMGCLQEALYALRAIACNLDEYDYKYEKLKIFISFSLNDNGNLRSNEDINFVIKSLESWMKSNELNIKIISMNCCKPEAINKALNNINNESLDILNKYDVYIGAYPNGTGEIKKEWTLKEGGFNPIRQDLQPHDLYNRFYKQWILKYFKTKRLRLLGGCCNIEPHHIKYMSNAVKNDFPQLLSPKSVLKSKLYCFSVEQEDEGRRFQGSSKGYQLVC